MSAETLAQARNDDHRSLTPDRRSRRPPHADPGAPSTDDPKTNTGVTRYRGGIETNAHAPIIEKIMIFLISHVISSYQ